MRKFTCLLFILLQFSKLSFSQKDSSITPIHLIKVDLLKSVFSDLHFSYERFNGKKGSWEIGVGMYYPNKYLDEKYGKALLYYFSTNGYEADLKRKFFLRSKKNAIYLSPVLKYSNKYWKNVARLDDAGNGNYLTGNSQTTGLMVEFGASSKQKSGINVNAQVGIGLCYRSLNGGSTNIEGAEPYFRHYNLTQPMISLGACVGFGFKGKVK